MEKQRPMASMRLQRRRGDFCHPCLFSDRDSHQAVPHEYWPHKNPNFELRKREMECGTQCGAGIQVGQAEVATQTAWFRKVNTAVQYEPIEYSKEKKEQQLESEEFREFLAAVDPDISACLQQNETIDVFRDAYHDFGEDDFSVGHKAETIRELRTFADLQYSKNMSLLALDWHPRNQQIIAVSCCENLSFDQRVDISGMPRRSYILIWKFTDLIHPQLVLESPQDVMVFAYNPSNPNILAGGCMTGQVIYWDLSKADAATQLSAKSLEEGEEKKSLPLLPPEALSTIDNSHRRQVTSLTWLPKDKEINSRGEVTSSSNTASQQFLTVAPDGALCFWDLRFRDMVRKRKAFQATPGTEEASCNWNPLFKITIMKPEGMGELGLTQVVLLGLQGVSGALPKGDEGSPAVAPLPYSVLYGSTEDGELVKCDWRARTGMDEEHVKWTVQDHHRPTFTLDQSAFFPELFLTCSDSKFSVWKEGVDVPLFTSPFSEHQLTCACWSTIRPAVLFLGKVNGIIEIWDLLDQTHKPVLSAPVVSSKICTMKLWNSTSGQRQLLGAGDIAGNLHILDIPRSARKKLTNEEELMKSLCDRECARIAYIKEHAPSVVPQDEVPEAEEAKHEPEPTEEGGAEEDKASAELDALDKLYATLSV